MKQSISFQSRAPIQGLTLDSFVPEQAFALMKELNQRALPSLARNPDLLQPIIDSIHTIPTKHSLHLGDSRDLSFIQDESMHLVVTSPPYWTLKQYPEQDGQLGGIEDYDQFLDELDKVWAQCLRILVPGGRLVVVVGDVCLSRRRFGRHSVLPLHSSIQEHCRKLGFDNLAPIIWVKIANAKYEANNGSRFLGKPYEPNGIIKNDIEYILFQRKPGGYRRPSIAARLLSVIPEQDQRQWFQQIWNLSGTSTKRHPAPFSIAIAERLIRMFSFVGDIVLDPFTGTGTTNVAACEWGRHSIGIEVNPDYYEMAAQRLDKAIGPVFSNPSPTNSSFSRES